MVADRRNQAAVALHHLADDIESGGRERSSKLVDAMADELRPEHVDALAELEETERIDGLTYNEEWVEACEQRVAALRAGETTTVPASKVIEELRAELSRGL